jgi:hypothetical protein
MLPSQRSCLHRTDTLVLAGTDEAIDAVTGLASATAAEEEE